MRTKLVSVGVVAALAFTLVACDDMNTVFRDDAPVVLAGAALPDLVGEAPASIVAFAHSRPDGVPTWTQIPVQIDQRKVVDFGRYPTSNATVGVDGTVYGGTAIGHTSLQYADAGTFVGADSDPTFDADDELVFMAADAGGKPREGEESLPPGVVPGSGVRVQLDDPLGEDNQAWVHLFVSNGALDPAAGRDYVDYDFVLTSGAYKPTYRRADGPNPETSRVTTADYQIDYVDRWKETAWRITAGAATGVDILDANKNQFAIDFCGRSNATFADAEGAFVANIDGPVRGIRSYVGANSGPLTQRTHLMYRDSEQIVTDLRVHAIPAVMDFLDFSTAAVGMTYASSAVPGGVTVDGAADAVGTADAEWELVTGAPGSVLTTLDWNTDIAFAGGLDAARQLFYRDEMDATVTQCWGDPHFLGASGSAVVQTIPNTDPALGAFSVFQATRTVEFGPPQMSTTAASTLATEVRTPLGVTVSAYVP